MNTIPRRPPLFFHMGSPKTGTTAIQQTLAKSIDGSEQRDVLYPQAFRDLEGIAHHELPEAIRRSPLIAFTTLFDEYCSESKKRWIRSAIVSSEGLFSMLAVPRDSEKLLEFISQSDAVFDVVPIISLRNPAEFIEKIYIQNIVDRSNFLHPLTFASGYFGELIIYFYALKKLALFSENLIITEYSKPQALEVLSMMTGGNLTSMAGAVNIGVPFEAAMISYMIHRYDIDLPVDFFNVLIFNRNLAEPSSNFIASLRYNDDEMDSSIERQEKLHHCHDVFLKDSLIFKAEVEKALSGATGRQAAILGLIAKNLQQHRISVDISKIIIMDDRFRSAVSYLNQTSFIRWLISVAPKIEAINGQRYEDTIIYLSSRLLSA